MTKKTKAKKVAKKASLGPLFERVQEKTADESPAKASSDKLAQKPERKVVPKAKTARKKATTKAPKTAKKARPSKEDSTAAASVQAEPAQTEEPKGRKTVIRRRGVVLNKAKSSDDDSSPEAISAPGAPAASIVTADPKAALLEGLKAPIRFDEAQSRVGAGYGPVMRQLVQAGLYFRHIGHQLWLLTKEGMEIAKAVQEGAELVLEEASSAASPGTPERATPGQALQDSAAP